MLIINLLSVANPLNVVWSFQLASTIGYRSKGVALYSHANAN